MAKYLVSKLEKLEIVIEADSESEAIKKSYSNLSLGWDYDSKFEDLLTYRAKKIKEEV